MLEFNVLLLYKFIISISIIPLQHRMILFACLRSGWAIMTSRLLGLKYNVVSNQIVTTFQLLAQHSINWTTLLLQYCSAVILIPETSNLIRTVFQLYDEIFKNHEIKHYVTSKNRK